LENLSRDGATLQMNDWWIKFTATFVTLGIIMIVIGGAKGKFEAFKLSTCVDYNTPKVLPPLEK